MNVGQFVFGRTGLGCNGWIEPIVGSYASLHQRTPFVFGSKEEVETVKRFYADPKSVHSPLFRTSGYLTGSQQ